MCQIYDVVQLIPEEFHCGSPTSTQDGVQRVKAFRTLASYALVGKISDLCTPGYSRKPAVDATVLQYMFKSAANNSLTARSCDLLVQSSLDLC